MTDTDYVAGACNIGPAEIARRRLMGWIGLGIALIVSIVLLWTGVGRWWRLAVFLPATLSASGFLQARFHFCVGFARMGVSNFGAIGESRPVGSDAARAADGTRGRQLTLYAVLIGLVVTAALAAVA